MKTISDDTAFRALVERDSHYEGLFFAAITTTGIFCRPTCHARKPRQENTLFFETTQEALAHGFRPCKLCHPMEPAGHVPEEIRAILSRIEESPDRKITDGDLAQAGYSPSRIRRWFLSQHGMSFQAYQRMYRINRALGRIRDGESVTDAAFDAGYESLSGFQHSVRKAVAKSPREARGQVQLTFERLETPLGPMMAISTGEGICLLEFTDRWGLETELSWLRKHYGTEILPGTDGHLRLLGAQLTEYFAGTRRMFDIPLVTPGSEFQNRVWSLLQTIPYGTTASYGEQAAKLGSPKSVRAVAGANGKNRIAIVIPCHRVIGSDGSLTGYAGGLSRKRWLLDHEARHAES